MRMVKMPSMIGMVRVATARAIAGTTRPRAPFGGESGNVLILAAVLFPVVIGAMGLGAETGYWYWTQRKLQHAADVSAYAGAVRLRAGDDLPEIKVAAINVAAESGAAVPFVDLPMVRLESRAPALNGDENSVEVIITRSQPRLFSAVVARFSGDGENADVAITARAVAQVKSETSGGTTPGGCVLALSSTASPAVTVSGSANVNLTGCDVHTNSNAPDAVLLSGNGELIADCVSSVGGTEIKGAAELTVSAGCPKEEAGSIPDPYADVAAPVINPGHVCKKYKKNDSLQPTDTDPSRPGVKSKCFSDLHVTESIELPKDSLYIIDGGELTITGKGSLTGKRITIYLTGGATININTKEKIELSAPTSGPFKGILFFGDRNDDVDHKITGGANLTLQGAIYTAGSEVEYTGNSAAVDGCTQIIADTVSFTGNSTMEASKESCKAAGFDPADGNPLIATNQTVELVE